MSNETLSALITDKGFDNYKDALQAKCDKAGIDLIYSYGSDGKSLTVWLNFGNIPATIAADVSGNVTFTYFQGGGRVQDNFSDFTAQDFHTLLDHAYVFLRDGTFDAHSEWYSALRKA